MKLVSVSALALAATGAHANIEDIIKNAINEIYTEKADGSGFTVALEPYFTMDLTNGDNGYSSFGTYGNGGETPNSWKEEIKWSDTSFEMTQENKGTVDQIPGYTFLYPESLHGSNFDVVQHMEASFGDLPVLEGTYKGHIDNKNFDSEGRLALEEFEAGKKMSTKIRFSGSMTQDAGFNDYAAKWMMPAGNHNVLLSAKAASECAVNPLQNACSVNVKLTGTFKSQDIGKNKVSYSVKGNNVAMIRATRNKVDVFSLKLSGFKTLDFIELNYKCAKSQPKWKLIIKVPGPVTWPAVTAAFDAFIKPFKTFVEAFGSPHDLAHAVAYADIPMGAAVGMNLFDCSALVQSTGVESALLADALGWKSIQNELKKQCKAGNAMIEGYLAQGAPFVSDARAYVKNVVSDDGAAKAQAFYDGIAENL